LKTQVWKLIIILYMQTHSRKLQASQESVCLAVKEGGLYAIGCRSYTLLLDPRTLHSVKKISAKFSGCGKLFPVISLLDDLLFYKYDTYRF